jgi:uncharacterized integral membrane protein (TIGR00697 family)
MNSSIEQTKPPEPGYRVFHAMAMIFVATLLISNTIAVKIITVAGLTLPAGIICFPIAYIFGDTLTEVYGYAKTRSVIWWGFFCLAGMSAFFWVATLLPAAPFWNDQASFAKLFGFVPRIAASSFVAYLVGEFLNSFVLSKIKIKMNGRHFWFRAVASTVVGQAADSTIFNLLAFSGVFPMKSVLFIAFSGFILKSLYEVLALPLTYLIVGWLKKTEGINTFDRGVNYTPFKLEAL